mgnify:CR=1 FL=1
MDEEIVVTVDADVTRLEDSLSRIEQRAKGFGSTVTRAFRDIAFEGRSVENVFRSIAMSIAGRALDAGLAPLERALDGFAARAFGGLAGGMHRLVFVFHGLFSQSLDDRGIFPGFQRPAPLFHLVLGRPGGFFRGFFRRFLFFPGFFQPVQHLGRLPGLTGFGVRGQVDIPGSQHRRRNRQPAQQTAQIVTE